MKPLRQTCNKSFSKIDSILIILLALHLRQKHFWSTLSSTWPDRGLDQVNFEFLQMALSQYCCIIADHCKLWLSQSHYQYYDHLIITGINMIRWAVGRLSGVTRGGSVILLPNSATTFSNTKDFIDTSIPAYDAWIVYSILHYRLDQYWLLFLPEWYYNIQKERVVVAKHQV